jgi:acetoin utilization deacetylase AcuC-like enzyme
MLTTIYAPLHTQHDPPLEFLEGRLGKFTEAPIRATMIQRALETAALGPIRPPEDFGLEPIRSVHSDEYLEHLRTIHARWTAEGLPPDMVLPSSLPVRELRRPSPALFAQVGYYAFDLSAPVAGGTYAAALDAAHCALTGARLLLEGERLAYALCRPPGHHAHRDMMGGFCYLNNAAVAADLLARAPGGNGRVAVLDIDVHAGNGTQAIFYERADVLFLSLHGDPAWEYPYFAGFADERGAGPGAGLTRNFPLPQGLDDAGYQSVLAEALAELNAFAPGYLVLSAGFDAFKDDPLSKLKLTTPGYGAIGAQIAALNIPTLVVQEGGYAVEALGENAVSLLRGMLALAG